MKKTILIILLSLLASASLAAAAFSGTADTPNQNLDLERAIWEYKHENYEEALEILTTLRQTKPDSSLVAYYLGITYKQMQNYAAAKEPLVAAATLQPRIKNAVMELIDLLYKKGDLDEAKRWIQLAEKESLFPAQTAFFKGLVLMKENADIQDIEEAFSRAKSLDPAIANTCDYYLGLAYVKSKKTKEAKKLFQDISLKAPGTSVAAFADQYIGAISRKEEVTRPFRGNIGAAVQYDDNVVLFPDNERIVATSGPQADCGRCTLLTESTLTAQGLRMVRYKVRLRFLLGQGNRPRLL